MLTEKEQKLISIAFVAIAVGFPLVLTFIVAQGNSVY